MIYVGDDLISLVEESIRTANINKKDGGAAYICFPWRTYTQFETAIINAGLNIKSCIVWDKKCIGLGLGLANYRPQHEFIFYCSGEFYGGKSETDVWVMGRDGTTTYVHPTQKPVALIERALKNSSKQGDVIHDCFGGSGSTLIACEKLNRSARLMELDPKYVDTIIKRWQEFTNKIAIHESTGKPFNETITED